MSDVLPPQETISEMRGSSESIESISLALDARRVRLVGLWILLAALFPVSLGISGGLYLTRLIPEVEHPDTPGGGGMRMVVVRGRRNTNDKKNNQMYHLQRNNSFTKNIEKCGLYRKRRSYV